MPLMIVQKIHALNDPRVEATVRMFCHLAHNVYAIFEPRKFAARGRRPNRNFAVFAQVAGFHRRHYCFTKEKRPCIAAGALSLLALGEVNR
jgi:hypothetical protein